MLLETAVGTGNRLLRFSSESPDPAYALFEAELGSPTSTRLQFGPRRVDRLPVRAGPEPFRSLRASG